MNGVRKIFLKWELDCEITWKIKIMKREKKIEKIFLKE